MNPSKKNTSRDPFHLDPCHANCNMDRSHPSRRRNDSQESDISIPEEDLRRLLPACIYDEIVPPNRYKKASSQATAVQAAPQQKCDSNNSKARYSSQANKNEMLPSASHQPSFYSAPSQKDKFEQVVQEKSYETMSQSVDKSSSSSRYSGSSRHSGSSRSRYTKAPRFQRLLQSQRDNTSPDIRHAKDNLEAKTPEASQRPVPYYGDIGLTPSNDPKITGRDKMSHYSAEFRNTLSSFVEFNTKMFGIYGEPTNLTANAPLSYKYSNTSDLNSLSNASNNSESSVAPNTTSSQRESANEDSRSLPSFEASNSAHTSEARRAPSDNKVPNRQPSNSLSEDDSEDMEKLYRAIWPEASDLQETDESSNLSTDKDFTSTEDVSEGHDDPLDKNKEFVSQTLPEVIIPPYSQVSLDAATGAVTVFHNYGVPPLQDTCTASIHLLQYVSGCDLLCYVLFLDNIPVLLIPVDALGADFVIYLSETLVFNAEDNINLKPISCALPQSELALLVMKYITGNLIRLQCLYIFVTDLAARFGRRLEFKSEVYQLQLRYLSVQILHTQNMTFLRCLRQPVLQCFYRSSILRPVPGSLIPLQATLSLRVQRIIFHASEALILLRIFGAPLIRNIFWVSVMPHGADGAVVLSLQCPLGTSFYCEVLNLQAFGILQNIFKWVITQQSDIRSEISQCHLRVSGIVFPSHIPQTLLPLPAPESPSLQDEDKSALH